MKNKNPIPFFDYVNQINAANKNWSLNGNTYPNTNYVELTFEKYKEMIYNNTFMRLFNIILKMYKWTTPKYIEPRAIEMGYILAGQISLFKCNKGTFCLPCFPHNRFNIYGNPVQVKTQGFNGFQLTIDIIYDKDNDIPIQLDNNEYMKTLLEKTDNYGIYSRDNDLAYPYINYINEYAYALTDMIIAHHIATQRIKTPYIWVINEKELKTTIDDLMQKIRENDIYTVLVKNNSMKDLDKCLRLENINLNPAIVKEIENAIVSKFGMYCETIGIKNNPMPDKSQVVLTSEINANNSIVDAGNNIRLHNREEFCKNAKEIMGIDIQVEKNVDIMEEVEKEKGEMLNGNENKETENA